jgi:hypothetical protein
MLKPMNSNDINDIRVSNNNNDNTGNSGQGLIQCGGYGNLQQIITMLERITHLDQFKEYFTYWKQPWHFAKAEDTNELLQRIGYVNTAVYYSDDYIF